MHTNTHKYLPALQTILTIQSLNIVVSIWEVAERSPIKDASRGVWLRLHVILILPDSPWGQICATVCPQPGFTHRKGAPPIPPPPLVIMSRKTVIITMDKTMDMI